MSPDVEIIYIGGAARSGSTVLTQLVAGACRGIAVGEVKDIWHAGVHRNDLCGCGRPFAQCDFWRAVGREAFGGWDAAPTAALIKLQRRIDRFRNFPLLRYPALLKRTDRGFYDDLIVYGRTLRRMYRAIRIVSDRRIIVEASKHPAQPLLLATFAGFPVQVIHLIRDSRGVAWSFQKRIGRPEVVATDMLMPHKAASDAARLWVVTNIAFHLLPRGRTRRVRVRYEEYVSSPAASLARIQRFVRTGAHADSADTFGESAVNFASCHTLGGNPVRFAKAPMPLRLDEEWRHKMPRADRCRVEAITFPLLLGYGYIGKRGRLD